MTAAAATASVSKPSVSLSQREIAMKAASAMVSQWLLSVSARCFSLSLQHGVVN
jgi:hypothetical protein